MGEKRVALVTGGGRGIGFGISKQLASSGFDIVFSGRKAESEVQGPMEELKALGAAVLYVQSDVAVEADRVRLIETIQQTCGRLDVLVNNAGVAPNVRADILEAGGESFDRLIDINLKGPYFLTQLAANYMIEQRKAKGAAFQGCIVFVSSISATVASVNRGDYCLSKAGIAMAAQLYAARLADEGIMVFEVRPGIIQTDMTAGVKEKYDKLFAEGIALIRRWGQPEDIGKAVAALARGDIPYATGEVLNIDGGFTVQTL